MAERENLNIFIFYKGFGLVSLDQRCPTLEKNSPQMWQQKHHCCHNFHKTFLDGNKTRKMLSIFSFSITSNI